VKVLANIMISLVFAPVYMIFCTKQMIGSNLEIAKQQMDEESAGLLRRGPTYLWEIMKGLVLGPLMVCGMLIYGILLEIDRGKRESSRHR
jgi:hypothetical protein